MTILASDNSPLPGESPVFPLVVDLDGTFLKVDTLFEMFVAGIFARPIESLKAIFELRHGIAAFKRRISDAIQLDVETLPVNDELLTYLQHEAATGREIHLATAADRHVASRIAERHPFFKSVQATDEGLNLKGPNKARRLQQLFPDGYVYAGDSLADIPVWKSAKAAILVSPSSAINLAVRSADIPVERVFVERRSRLGAWIKEIRPHQWAKNIIVLVPLLLGWRDVTLAGLVATLVVMGLLCVVASLTYFVNDMADLASDRKHWSKRRRGFASGVIPLRTGLIAVATILPLACACALLISPPAGVCLVVYVVVTLGYSFGWKKIPIFDAFVIGLLFTIRVLIGIAAAALTPSAWILAFSMFFFFSLALAKRHTEILRSADHGLKKLEGRGYDVSDASMTLPFGISAAMASVVIVVIYLVEEVFARQLYHAPQWLWIAPIAIFLFISRIWVLSQHSRMTDDPVAFALRDRVSLVLGGIVAAAILLAI